MLAVALLVVSRRSRHYLAWPVAILSAALLFYLTVLLSGRPLSQWRAEDHLLGPFPEADLLQGLAPADLALVDPDKPWVVSSAKMAASAGNTPFDGQPVQGRTLALWKGGMRIEG